MPVSVTRDGEAGDAVIATRRVNDTDIYTLGRNDLATKLKISQFEASALIELLEVQADPECYKVIRIGSQAHKRYSMKALDVLAKARAAGRIGEAVKHLKARRTGRAENRVAVR